VCRKGRASGQRRRDSESPSRVSEDPPMPLGPVVRLNIAQLVCAIRVVSGAAKSRPSRSPTTAELSKVINVNSRRRSILGTSAVVVGAALGVCLRPLTGGLLGPEAVRPVCCESETNAVFPQRTRPCLLQSQAQLGATAFTVTDWPQRASRAGGQHMPFMIVRRRSIKPARAKLIDKTKRPMRPHRQNLGPHSAAANSGGDSIRGAGPPLISWPAAARLTSNEPAPALRAGRLLSGRRHPGGAAGHPEWLPPRRRRVGSSSRPAPLHQATGTQIRSGWMKPAGGPRGAGAGLAPV
jgi:hypothetical protein